MKLHNRFLISSIHLALCTALLTSMNAMADDSAVLESARSVASAMPPKLLKVLTEEIAQNGVAAAIGVCNVKAPQMAKAASEQSGWTIRRVSLRNRSPKAVPDAWERATLQEFDQRALAGEDPAKLEKYATLDEAGRKEFRYMKALPTQKSCLACHGELASIQPDVAEKIHAMYPDDKATGYAEGQLRGAITLRKMQ